MRKSLIALLMSLSLCAPRAHASPDEIEAFVKWGFWSLSGLVGFGLGGFAAYDATRRLPGSLRYFTDIAKSARKKGPYSHRGKPYLNNCHGPLILLTHTKLELTEEAHDALKLSSFVDLDAEQTKVELKNISDKYMVGPIPNEILPDRPGANEPNPVILAPKTWRSLWVEPTDVALTYGVAFGLSYWGAWSWKLHREYNQLLGSLWAFINPFDDDEDSLDAPGSILDGLGHPPMRYERVPFTPADISRMVLNSPDVAQKLEVIYGKDRAHRIQLFLAESPEWKVAFEELAKADTLEEIDRALEEQGQKLDKTLENFKNKHPRSGRSDIILEALPLKDPISAEAWKNHRMDDEFSDKARPLFTERFYDDTPALPWEAVPEIERAFTSGEKKIYDAVMSRNADLPPTLDEDPVKNGRHRPADYEALDLQHIRALSGGDEVRIFMAPSTVHLVDDLFGKEYEDMADHFLINLAQKWKYPDLMINYKRSRDSGEIQKKFQRELSFMRKLFITDEDPSKPLQNEEEERLAQWAAVELTLFDVLIYELPRGDDTIEKAVESIRNKLKKGRRR